uniref:Candidate secreted effector n=1 Tax=Meloidogyne incognita TaxID=6306 RepID=A0A914L9I2_MELIC
MVVPRVEVVVEGVLGFRAKVVGELRVLHRPSQVELVLVEIVVQFLVPVEAVVVLEVVLGSLWFLLRLCFWFLLRLWLFLRLFLEGLLRLFLNSFLRLFLEGLLRLFLESLLRLFLEGLLRLFLISLLIRFLILWLLWLRFLKRLWTLHRYRCRCRYRYRCWREQYKWWCNHRETTSFPSSKNLFCRVK